MGLLQKITNPTVRSIIQALLLQVELFVEKLEGFFGNYRVDTQHYYTPEENHMIDQSAEILQKYFPTEPGAALLEEDFESRCQALEDLAAELIAVYGLTGVTFVITADEELFPVDRLWTFGCTLVQEKVVCINANLLRSDRTDVLSHIVSTVIHELRHVMQYEIMTLENTRGVSYQRRKAWRYTTINYVSGSEDMEEYVKQSTEFDARNFQSRVWQGAYHTTVPMGGD